MNSARETVHAAEHTPPEMDGTTIHLPPLMALAPSNATDESPPPTPPRTPELTALPALMGENASDTNLPPPPKDSDVSAPDREVVGATDPSAAPVPISAPDDDFDILWHRDRPVGPQTRDLCKRLASAGFLYRLPTGELACLRVGVEPRWIRDPVDLEAVIRENFRVGVFKAGELKGYAIPSGDLKILLRSTELQNSLPVVDKVLATPSYGTNWSLTQPGYNHGAIGERFFYTGAAVVPKTDPVCIRRFLAAMAFKCEGDKANALALALTILVRHMWPGSKPIGLITGNKSHSGKDTILDFATGPTSRIEISYSRADWALQQEAVAALADPNVGVLAVGNVRSSGVVESAFLERTITSSAGKMQSSKRRGDGYQRTSDFVVCATANACRFSTDLANRGLPIHLELIGDIQNRRSDIGDPRRDFLPQHRDEITAELCGLVENWKRAGMPLDDSAQHPMKAWAATIGGILRANGIVGFLTNWTLQRNANDATREALALIADEASLLDATRNGIWLRVSRIRELAEVQGVIPTLIDSRHRHSTRAIERELGTILSNHRDETLLLERDGEVRSYRLERARNSQTGIVATVYRFVPVNGSHEEPSA